MSFPFDHHHNHHSHHRRDDEQQEEYRNYPPPPSNYYPPPPSNYYPPPPPPGGGPYPPPSNYPPPSFDGPHPPPPPFSGSNYPPPSNYYPPPEAGAGVYHTSHDNPHESYQYPPVVTIPEHHHSHHHGDVDGSGSHSFHLPEMGRHPGPGLYDPGLGDLATKPTYAIYCKAGGDRFAVAIRDSKLVLTYADVNDPTQHWIKDEKYSTKVKDKDGYPSFCLVNRGTNHALKHSLSAHPVQLSHHKPEFFDVSVLWTESNDLGDGYRTIRTVNNTKLVMDAFHGDKDHGGVHDGTIVALYESWKGDNQNQQWKLVPYCM